MLNRKKRKRAHLVLSVILYLVFFNIILLAQDIVFILPKSLKVSTNTVTIKGAVMDFDTTEIDIAVVNLIDLVKEQKAKRELAKKEKEKKPENKEPWLNTLDYETIPVANGFFQTTLQIKEGINAILAKPVKVEATPQNTQMRVVVLDRVSPKIELIYPQTDRIAQLKGISGKIKRRPYPKTVTVTIEALMTVDSDGEKTYKMNKLLEVIVPVKRKKFNLPVALRELLTGDEIVIITISADGVEVTKTLF